MRDQATRYRLGPPLTPVVKAFLMINIVFFLLVSVLFDGLFQSPLAGLLYQILAFDPQRFLTQFFLWQPLTYVFVHHDLFHLFWNMVTLFMFGSELEGFWGRRPFFLFYFLCAIGGAFGMLVFAWFSPASASLTMGASGAIMGCVVAYGMVFADRSIFLLFPPIPIKAKTMAIIWVAVDLILFVKQPDSKVAYMAHLGGALTAFLYMKSSFRFALAGPLNWNFKHLHPRQILRRRKMKKYLRVIDKADEPEKQDPTFH